MKTYTLALAGAGFATALFIGCDLGQNASGNTQDTQAALLSLSVKDSAGCEALHARCAANHHDGRDSAALTDSLVGACIIDTARAHDLMKGREGHGGRHGGFRGDHDGDGPGRPDSAARSALCDSLTKAVAGMDSTDSGYAEAKEHAARACFVPPALLDSAARAALCDSLKTSLAAADSASAGYGMLARQTHEACEAPEGRDEHNGRRGGHRRPHRR